MILNEANVKREAALLPETTEGYCKEGNPKVKSHGHFSFQELANGYCVECWDNGRGGALTYNQRSNRNHNIKKKKKKEETKQNE